MTSEQHNFDQGTTSRREKIDTLEKLMQFALVADINLENGYNFSGRIALVIENSVWIQRWDPINLRLSQESIIVELDSIQNITIP